MAEGLPHVMCLVQVLQVQDVVLLTHQVLHQTFRAQPLCTETIILLVSHKQNMVLEPVSKNLVTFLLITKLEQSIK